MFCIFLFMKIRSLQGIYVTRRRRCSSSSKHPKLLLCHCSPGPRLGERPFFLKSCLQRSCKTGSEKPAQKDRLRKHFGGNFPSFCLSKKRGLDRHLRIQPRCTELDGTSERRGLASEKGGFQGAIFGRVRPFSATMKRVAAENRLSGPPHTMCASALR